MSARKEFEATAERWERDGRPDDQLASDWRLLVLRCWSWSPGGTRDGTSDALRTYMAASVARQHPDWLDDLLDDRGTCRGCGQGYRLENLMACTSCLETRCHACGAQAPKAANGNPACPCGGELVG